MLTVQLLRRFAYNLMALGTGLLEGSISFPLNSNAVVGPYRISINGRLRDNAFVVTGQDFDATAPESP